MQIQRYNEIDLIRQTLAGDTSAFDRLVKTHRATVYVLVLSYTKNPADAEDLTQRIFIRAYERLATLRELDRFLPWLQRITHNACKDWIRRQSDSMTSFEEMNHADFMETVPTPEEIALKREIEAVVREAIGALKETDRKLVEGRYIEGASYDQLQVESGLSYAAIANRLKRAKQQMRRRIEKLLGGMAILPGRTFIWGGIETVKLLANCIIFSLVVHLLAILMFSALRKPVVGPVEDALTVTLSTIKHPVLKREARLHKPVVPIRAPRTLAAVAPREGSPRVHQDSAPSSIRIAPLHFQHSANNVLPSADVGLADGEDFGEIGGNGDGSGDGTGRGIEINPVLGERVMPNSNLFNRTGVLQSPMAKNKLAGAVTLVDAYNLDPLQPPTLTPNRSNRVDVVFLISCRRTMRPYINDVVAFIEREIQQYQASRKDYRVGIMISEMEFIDGPHYIRYFSLSDQLDKALEALKHVQLKPLYIDIQLNTIQYALERCAFRPDAQRHLISFGNDIPICGGYSAKSVIERCQTLGVVLNIHGADTQVGPLLASQTGGKWVPAFKNPYDIETLEILNHHAPYWRLNITLDSVVELPIRVSH